MLEEEVVSIIEELGIDDDSDPSIEDDIALLNDDEDTSIFEDESMLDEPIVELDESIKLEEVTEELGMSIDDEATILEDIEGTVELSLMSDDDREDIAELTISEDDDMLTVEDIIGVEDTGVDATPDEEGAIEDDMLEDRTSLDECDILLDKTSDDDAAIEEVGIILELDDIMVELLWDIASEDCADDESNTVDDSIIELLDIEAILRDETDML